MLPPNAQSHTHVHIYLCNMYLEYSRYIFCMHRGNFFSVSNPKQLFNTKIDNHSHSINVRSTRINHPYMRGGHQLLKLAVARNLCTSAAVHFCWNLNSLGTQQEEAEGQGVLPIHSHNSSSRAVVSRSWSSGLRHNKGPAIGV